MGDLWHRRGTGSRWREFVDVGPAHFKPIIAAETNIKRPICSSFHQFTCDSFGIFFHNCRLYLVISSLCTHQVSLNWTHAFIQMLYIILVFWNSLPSHISCCDPEEKCRNSDSAVLICFAKRKILPLINAARQTEWKKKEKTPTLVPSDNYWIFVFCPCMPCAQ